MTAKSSPADSASSSGNSDDLSQRLARARRGFGLGDLLLGPRTLDADLVEDIEEALLGADAGMDATRFLIDEVQARAKRKELDDARAVYRVLRTAIRELLRPCARPLVIHKRARPYVIMAVGVNGVGKTTTCGKLAQRLAREGHMVMLAAADTFRAAAVEQLQQWGTRLNIPVIAQHTGADAAAVAHDAMEAARARGADVLIVDTAGRQHTAAGLMDELKKVRRVIQKLDADAPDEVLLVLDGGTGQNALAQLKHFHEAVGVTGIVLTKLDGTARGGIMLAIARQGGQPIRFIGVGEQANDLRVFDADAFVDALLPETER
jgi:fused signal recognition particle receptor